MLAIRHDVYSRRHVKRKRDGNALQGELKKIKPRTFDGEKYGEIADIWLLEMKKYLHLHDYSENQEAQISIYNFHGKYYRWWKYLKQVESLDERKM